MGERCDECGGTRSPSTYAPKDGRHLCRDCRGWGRRRLTDPPRPTMTCPQCGTAYTPKRISRDGTWSKTCSTQCGQWRRQGVPPGSRGRGKNARRYERELSRPGLNRWARTKLRLAWIAEGRVCAYCPDLATTVDHIYPLHLGGTNFLSNLAPACRPCNTSKGRLTLAEWGGRSEHPLRDLRDSVPGEAVLGSVLRGALQEEGAEGPEPSR